jgi:hypothetical protein
MTCQQLVDRWRADSEVLRRNGCETAAQALEARASELEAVLRNEAAETLTLRQAAQESGYSHERLRHLIAAGDIANAGRKGAPRIRRADLPRKAQAKAVSGGSFDAFAAARRATMASRGGA